MDLYNEITRTRDEVGKVKDQINIVQITHAETKGEIKNLSENSTLQFKILTDKLDNYNNSGVSTNKRVDVMFDRLSLVEKTLKGDDGQADSYPEIKNTVIQWRTVMKFLAAILTFLGVANVVIIARLFFNV